MPIHTERHAVPNVVSFKECDYPVISLKPCRIQPFQHIPKLSAQLKTKVPDTGLFNTGELRMAVQRYMANGVTSEQMAIQSIGMTNGKKQKE